MASETDTAQESVESAKDRDTEVVVSQPKGFLCRVKLKTWVQFPADRTFDILTQPDNTHIFRNIKAITYRKVLEDDRKGKQRIELEHEAEWRFLFLHGTFRTRLQCLQDRRAGTLDFKLVQAGMMKNFEGKWRIYASHGRAHAPKAPRPWLAFGRHAQGTGDQEQQWTTLELEQSVCPNVVPPPPVDRFLKGIAKRQVCNVVEDLRKEIERIKKEEAHKAKRR